MQDSSGLQLLIAEDSPVVRERLVAMAREHLPAESIATAGNGAEALAVFDRSDPDAVLLDIGLPDMSGLQVLEHIRRQGTSTEVVVFTSSTGPEMAARCHLLGANHFVDKAHDIRPVIESLRTITAPEQRSSRKTPPASQASLTDTSHLPHRLSRSSPVSVLVVEDDASQAEPLLKLLRRKLPHGSSVAQAGSQAEALDCILKGTFDVVLLDLGLPDCEGVEAVVALRVASAEFAIIVLSAQEEESTVQSAMECGADDYFVKGELAVSGVARAVTSAVERKRSARALTTALESRRRIMDSSVDVICTLDAGGRFAEVGAACERVWGYTREELIGRNATQWIAPADQAKTDRILDAVRGGAPAHGFENRFVRADGSEVDTMWSAVWSATDRLMYCVARDITERTRHEETLRATIESALDCIITIDESSTIIEFNPAAEQTFGWTRAEAIGRTLSETIIPQQFREGHARGMARLLATGEQRLIGKRIEITAMRAGGAEFPVELTIVRIGTDRPWRFTAFLRDITDRVFAREKLEAQEEQYRVLFETNPSAMWVYDLETLRILAVNDAAVEQYGYSRDEFLTRSLYDLRATIDADALTTAVSSKGSASRQAGTWSHQRKDGSTILVDVYSSPTDFEGTPARIAVLVDVTQRHEAQIALRKEREFLAAVVDNVSDGIVSCDASGVIALFNAATREFHGLPAEPIAADEWAEHFDLYLPDGKTLMRKEQIPLFRALEEGFVNDAEMVIAPREGMPRRVLASGQAFFNEQGEKVGAVVAMHDLTEREKAQDILRRSEASLAIAQSVSHTGSWEMSLDDKVADADPELHWSDENFRIFGFEPGAVHATLSLFFQLVHPDDRERIRTEFSAAASSGAPYSLEHRITWPDGTERDVHEQATFVREEASGAVIKVIGTTHDITERKQAERTMREQAEMLDLARDAIAIRGYDDRVITYWNKGAERLYGWTANEAIGQPVDFLYDGRGDNEAAKQTLEASGEFQGEVHQIARDGRSVTVNVRANVIRNSDGTPRSVLSIGTDITEHKKLESQFLRAQRLESIGTLASGVAHDLNNILAPILMSAPLLRDEVDSTLKNKIVDTIETSAERGAQIVKQVLTFARGVEGERVMLDPRHLIKEMAQIVEETFPKGIEVTTRYAEDLDLVEGDPTQLHQVLLNLAVNARDAMPAGGKLVLSAENFEIDEHYAAMTPGTETGPHVLITVSDTGTGIAPHIIEKMYDPFFTTKEIGKGTGLGLSTVLGIVKSHGGAVNAYSTPAGTSFRVLLPATPGASPHHPTKGAAELPRGRGETILVVDDEVAIREIAQLLLAKSGYHVLVADDGPSALALYAQQHEQIALVLTDFLMPIMNGLALARIIRKMNPGAKIIMSSGREEDCGGAELAPIGIAACLTKPYTQATLLRAFDRVLHRDSLTS